MSRQNRFLFGLARRFPWLARLPMWVMSKGAGSERLVRQMTRAMPEVDQAIIRRPEVWDVFKLDAAESFRQGARGAAWELVMYARPWGFRLEEITMQVHLWQGELDKNVPPSMGRYQAGAIPNCRATFYPGEGHISLPVNHLEEILGALTS
jgi:pimeloyl-ACP methyl ester carboxylesterase